MLSKKSIYDECKSGVVQKGERMFPFMAWGGIDDFLGEANEAIHHAKPHQA